MNLLQPVTAGLFDPQLQLEAEPDARETDLRGATIHADIIHTIAAIDQLTARLQRPPESSLR
ncbi:MAG: hypothetical protein Q7J43_21195 [Pseudomonas sp.]|uniref:hypothetical protein n=1 Tax=Pseudomonas sp. TaxID=306 RepID=UPI00271D5656|nr:hypothetical protein [Pseudomonas sp.]MDO9620188.1 hypothetical protein [Pseudomonas sp.]MDP2446669.1 hypothetical protein [Pseudomonas sp.]MDZ4334438.1 hypothetical protein [Pseudomonas sp.]